MYLATAAVEDVLEGVQEAWNDVLYGDVGIEEFGKRRDTFVTYSARYYVSVPTEVGVAVKSEAVRRDALAHVDT